MDWISRGDVLVGDHGRGGGGAVVQPGSHGEESLGVMDRRASCGGMNQKRVSKFCFDITLKFTFRK